MHNTNLPQTTFIVIQRHEQFSHLVEKYEGVIDGDIDIGYLANIAIQRNTTDLPTIIDSLYVNPHRHDMLWLESIVDELQRGVRKLLTPYIEQQQLKLRKQLLSMEYISGALLFHWWEDPNHGRYRPNRITPSGVDTQYPIP